MCSDHCECQQHAHHVQIVARGFWAWKMRLITALQCRNFKSSLIVIVPLTDTQKAQGGQIFPIRSVKSVMNLQENDAAMEKLTKLLELNPEDKSAKAEVTKLKRQQAASEAKLKGTFKKMFG